jgi:hypothetical protein
MDREQVKAYYKSEDARRMQSEPMFTPDFLRIKRAIVNLRPGEIIKYRCYNDIEVEMIKEALTAEERSRVVFTWMDFGVKENR